MSENPERLTRAIRWLQAYVALMTVALAALFFRSGTETEGVLRARGLIIEDDAGRERILIGAPIPEAANRVRTDTARLREAWGPRFAEFRDGYMEEYMSYYQDFKHSTNGILILSEGRLRPDCPRRPEARSERRHAHRAKHGNGDQ